MLHRFVEYTKKEAFIERVHGALFILKCPECGKEHGSASEPDFLSDVLWCWGNPTHEDWKAYKKERGLTNEDVAKIVGATADSVKSMTQPNKELPKWALSMLYEWKR